MVGSVDRNQQVTTPTTPAQLNELQKADEISKGYDQSNSVSYHTGGGLVQLPPGASEAPSIPAPDDAITGDVGNLKQQLAQQTAASLKGQVGGLTSTIPSELFTEESLNNMTAISGNLSRLSDASPEVLRNINSSLGELAGANRNDTLTSGQLEEVLMQISASLEDNSVKYAQENILIESEARQLQSNEKIEAIREQIDQANNPGASVSPSIVQLKLLAVAIFPPLAIWEGSLGIDRGINPGKNNAHLSIFTAAEIEYMNRPDEPPTQYYSPPVAPGLGVAANPTDPVFDATEGMAIAQNGMSHGDMMKLLLQMQLRDESSQKLADAIAALEAGDPILAKEILGDSVDQAGMDASLGDSLTIDASRQNPPTTPPPEKTDSFNARIAASDESQLQTSSSALEPQVPPVDAQPAPERQAEQELNDFLGQLAPIPAAAAEISAAAAEQEGQIQIRNPV